MSASAFSLSAAMPVDAFSIIQGEPVIGGLHGQTRHYFCPYCMSWMFTRPEGIADSIVNLRPTMLDDSSWFKPFIETYTSTKLPWAITHAVHSSRRFRHSMPMRDSLENTRRAGESIVRAPNLRFATIEGDDR